MFESEIKTAKLRLLDQIGRDTPFVYLGDILANEDIPLFYRNFFRAESERWIYEMQQARASDPRFDLTPDDFALTVKRYDDVCRAASRFSRADLESAVDQAVKVRLNYLLRPRVTLRAFAFSGNPTAKAGDLLRRLEFCTGYPYLLDALKAWIASQIDSNSAEALLSAKDFDAVVKQTDEEEIIEYTTDAFVDAMAPIFEFFAEVYDGTGADGIPTPAAAIFMDDKEITVFARAVEKVLIEQKKDVMTQAFLADLLAGVVVEHSEEAPADEPVDRGTGANEPAEEAEQPPADARAVLGENILDLSAMMQSLSAEVGDEGEPEEQNDDYDLPPIEGGALSAGAFAYRAPEPSREEPAAPHADTVIHPDDREVVDAPPILDCIDMYSRARIAKELFHSKINTFIDAIGEVDRARTRRTAEQALSMMFAKHGIDPSHEQATLLSEFVYQRFDPVRFNVR